ncbi:MAG TPA: hypothetical protein VKY89_22665 [Thermoanaerobaculia bacterium]|jgi:hypothetical protein|nr:hypothetical protein [Thermoanaerobaculia bacterium]
MTMDAQRLRDAYQRLQSLDDRLTHKVKPRAGGSLMRPSPDHLELALRDLATYTVELKEIVEELVLAIAGRPKDPGEG